MYSIYSRLDEKCVNSRTERKEALCIMQSAFYENITKKTEEIIARMIFGIVREKEPNDRKGFQGKDLSVK